MPATGAIGVIVQIEYMDQAAAPIGRARATSARTRSPGADVSASSSWGWPPSIAVVLVVVGAPPVARLVVFPFLAGAIVSLEQGRRHFCAGFGMAGIRNFGAREDLEHIADPAAKAADRRAALVMFGYSSLIAAAITALFVVLPI